MNKSTDFKGEKRPQLIAATKNKGKLLEINQILAGFPWEVISMEQAGFNEHIEENGSTFEENAIIKAKAVWNATGKAVIADDSGLEVDYLKGAPGVYSARYAGEGAADSDNNRKLLAALEGVPEAERTARFVCTIAVMLENGQVYTARGTCEGRIGFEPKGNNGFGYDPLFYVPEFGMTIAQMDSDAKNSISHRGKALRLMAERLKEVLG